MVTNPSDEQYHHDGIDRRGYPQTIYKAEANKTMTNPDNVGGLVWYVCTSCLLMVQLPSDTPTLGRCQCSPKGWSLRRVKLPNGYELRKPPLICATLVEAATCLRNCNDELSTQGRYSERIERAAVGLESYSDLCRAATAGGDAEVVRLRQLLAGTQEQFRVVSELLERNQAHHERMMKLMDSAPAGSGEVEAFCQRLDEVAAEGHDSGFSTIADLFEQAAALLRKLQQGADGWRPIETAPKDGSRFLLVSAGGPPWLGHWRGADVFPFGEAGWTRYNCFDRYWEPTHWMPLPDSPASQDQEGGHAGG